MANLGVLEGFQRRPMFAMPLNYFVSSVRGIFPYQVPNRRCSCRLWKEPNSTEFPEFVDDCEVS